MASDMILDMMAGGDTPLKDRLGFWKRKWEMNQIGFHNKEVHSMLVKHADKLIGGNKPANVFVPLCGKTLDMKWFADQGIEAVGVDVIYMALEQFFTDHSMEWEEAGVPAMGSDAKLLTSKTDPIKLYCGDILNFSVDIAGQFDAVWDRGSISALNREDLDKYVSLMKNLVKPGGRILMEVVQYDVSIMDDVNQPTKPPPPHPHYEEDLKSLYGPEFSVQYLDRKESVLAGKDIEQALFLFTRN